MNFDEGELRTIAEKTFGKNSIDGDFSERRLSPSDILIPASSAPGYKVLSLPKALRNRKSFQALIGYFSTPKFCFCKKSTQNKHITAVERFIKIVEEQHPAGIEINVAVLKAFIASCANEYTQFMAATHFIELRYAFNAATPNIYGPADSWPIEIKTAYVAFQKIKVRRDSGKTPPIGLYLGIPESDFSNKELLFGLRMGSLWILDKYNEFRNKLCSGQDLSRCLNGLKGEDIHQYREAFRGFSVYNYKPAQRNIHYPQILKSGAEVWKTIAEDPLMRELQFYTSSQLRASLVSQKFLSEEIFAEQDYKFLLQCFIRIDGTLCKKPRTREDTKEAKKKFRPYVRYFSQLSITVPLLWGEEFLTPTSLEKLLMVWLLSTERAQQAGIAALKIPDIIFGKNKSTLQISTKKLRLASKRTHAKPKDTTVYSNIYRRNSPPYKAYNRWIAQIERGREFIQNYNPDQHFIPETGKRIQGLISNKSGDEITESILPLLLIATEGTTWNKAFRTETLSAEKESAAFIEIIRNRLSHIWNGAKSSTIPPGVIGQSLVVETQLESNTTNSSNIVESKTVGHTPLTGRNIYKDRFLKIGVAEISDPVASFARRVGDDKIELAKTMALRLLESTRKASLAELEQIAGIESSASCVQHCLQELDAQSRLQISGEILDGDNYLIAQTDITAAQIFGYIRHLERNLPELLISSRHDSSVKHLSKLIFLRGIFEEFPSHLKKEGKSLAESLDFPFPPLD